jgi:hypothetical protein
MPATPRRRSGGVSAPSLDENAKREAARNVPAHDLREKASILVMARQFGAVASAELRQKAANWSAGSMAESGS